MKRISLFLAMALLLAALAFGAQSEALEVVDGLDVPASVDSIDGMDGLPTLEDDLSMDVALDDAGGAVLSDDLDLALDDGALVGAAGIADDPAAANEASLQSNDSTFTVGDYTYYIESGLATIDKYEGAATEVTLPTSVTYNGMTYRVTEVDDYAFSNAGISALTIPSTINYLSWCAFYGCENLTSVTINGDLRCYGGGTDCAFYKTGAASGGYSVTFGSGVTMIPDDLFSTSYSETDNLYAHVTSVTIPDTVTDIGKRAFSRCYDLKTVNWGANVQTIGESAFDYCSKLNTLSLPGRVTSIGYAAFRDCASLATVVLPNSLNKMGGFVFGNCVNLTGVTVNGDIQEDSNNPDWFDNTGTASGGYSVTFGAGVTSVPRAMFFTNRNKTDYQYAHVTAITFPDSLQEIGNSAFQDCYDLSGISWGGGLKKIGEYAFAYTDGLEELNLPASLTTVGIGAFYGWSKLQRLTLPKKTNYLGENAFRDCVNLTSVTINGTIQNTNSSLPVFYNTGTNSGGYTVTFGGAVKTVPRFLFYTDSSKTDNKYAHVTRVDFSDKITWIGDSAFKNCHDLASVKWASVTKIEDSAFAFDESLTALTLPETLYYIGSYAFKGCTGVEKLVLKGKKSLLVLGSGAFADCTDLASVTIDKNIEEFYSNPQAFYNTGTASGGYTVVFGSRATQIPCNLFYANSTAAANAFAHVTKVTIPDSVKTIRYGAFENCYDLATVAIGKGVTKIGQEAFRNCESLTSVKYAGSKGMWKAIDIDDYNDGNAPLHQVKISCAMKGVSSMTLNQYYVCLTKKKTATLKATVKPSNAGNKAVKWTTSDKNVAKVNNGKITAVNNGVCTVTATSADDADILQKCTVIVSPGTYYTSLLSKAGSNGTDKVNLGKKLFLVPVFANKKGWDIESYTSSDSYTAYVSSKGEVTLYRAGKVKLTVTARNGKKAYINLVIVDPKTPTKVTLNKTGTVNLKVGKTLQLKATVAPKTAVTTLTWSSSDTAVATVSSKGKVTARKAGTATITVKTSNGKSAKVTVKVIK